MSDFTTLDRTAASQFGVLTFEQLEAGGFSEHQIRRRARDGQLRRMARGVYAMAGTPGTWEQLASAASLAARPLGGLSHRAAARRYGFRTVDDEIDIVIRHPRQLRVPGAIVHRSRDLEVGDLTWVDGILTTTPERTICDLGLIFPDSEVQRILDHAVATDLVNARDIERLRCRITKQGRDGAGSIRRCLGDLPDDAPQTESGAEVLFLRMCEAQQLPPPALQVPVVVKGQQFRVDFAYPEFKVFIEVDGKATHGQTIEQIANDGGRQNLLVAEGWRPLRFTYRTLRTSPDWCAAQLRTILTGCPYLMPNENL